MKFFTRPILEINLNNLLDNYKFLKEMCSEAIAAAVVKEDSYGIGAKAVVEKLYTEGGCRHFFFAYPFEASEAVQCAPEAKFYIFQGMDSDYLDIFHKYKLIPVISSLDMFKFWKENRIEGVKPVINLETGLNRLGFRDDELDLLSEEDKNEFSMVMSHLACADDRQHPLNEQQLKRFDKLKAKYFPNLPGSLSASDGAFLGKRFHKDMVRLGGAVYGLKHTLNERNVMKRVVGVKARVIQTAIMKKGETAGYSAVYTASKDEKIAIISIGYGDGIFRSLSNKGMILGRVSMDNLIIKGDGLEVGDWVELLNDDYNQDDMADDAGTIGYEVISYIGKGGRYQKVYK